MVFFILSNRCFTIHINQCVSSSESHMPQSLDQFCSLYKCCPSDICLMVLMGSPSTAMQMTPTLTLFCRASPASVKASLSSFHGFKLPSSQTEVLLFGSVSLRRSVSTSSPSPVTSNHLLKTLGSFWTNSWIWASHVKGHPVLFPLPQKCCKNQIFTVIQSSGTLSSYFHFLLPDYWNSLFTCISQSSIVGLQLVQNSAARLQTNPGLQSHISPILASLHWLTVKFRILF